MADPDVVIVGGGMAGSTAAAMLTRAGYGAALVDPHETYPPDFRCEKLDESQVELLRATGLADELLSVADQSDCIWICRHGRIVEKRPATQYSARYELLVNRMRALAGDSIIVDKVTSIAPSADRQVVTLARSGEISARLVVVANGLNRALRGTLGLGQREISPNHSISIGFDIAPKGADVFPFRSLTYFPEDLAQRIAYLTLFPFGGVTRANLFVYRDMDDTWLQQIRETPAETLNLALPNLRRTIGEFEIPSSVQIRPATLYVTTNREQDGIVLVGDAAGTSCPSAGTGLNKVFTDVERLCSAYIPSWLATDGMSAEKISAFYADPAKTQCDAESLNRAFLAKRVATENGLRWRTRRALRYVAQRAVGSWRRLTVPDADASRWPLPRRTH